MSAQTTDTVKVNVELTSEAVKKGLVSFGSAEDDTDFLQKYPDFLNFTFDGPPQKLEALQRIFERQPGFDNWEKDINASFGICGTGIFNEGSGPPYTTSFTVLTKNRDSIREALVQARAAELISVPAYYSLWTQAQAASDRANGLAK